MPDFESQENVSLTLRSFFVVYNLHVFVWGLTYILLISVDGLLGKDLQQLGYQVQR